MSLMIVTGRRCVSAAAVKTQLMGCLKVLGSTRDMSSNAEDKDNILPVSATVLLIRKRGERNGRNRN